MVGSTTGDQVGGVSPLSNGHYVALSLVWDNGFVVDSGAVTFGFGTGGTTGPITTENSVLGTAAGGGSSMAWSWDYDHANRQLVVGRPADNIVTLFRPDLPVFAVYLPVIIKNAP